MSDHEDDDIEFDLPEPGRERPRLPGTDAEQMLHRLHEIVASARPMPLNRDRRVASHPPRPSQRTLEPVDTAFRPTRSALA